MSGSRMVSRPRTFLTVRVLISNCCRPPIEGERDDRRTSRDDERDQHEPEPVHRRVVRSRGRRYRECGDSANRNTSPSPSRAVEPTVWIRYQEGRTEPFDVGTCTAE